MSLRVVQLPDGRKAIIIRTSDRISFKQCRRKWGWSSHLKRNLGPKSLAGPLWFGSAIHYALEDFHGHNRFGKPSVAFRAYCISTSKQFGRDLPLDAQELYQLGIQMMDYYTDHWLRFRKVNPIYWEDGVPQVEVNFEIPLPLEEHPLLAEYARANGADCVLYRGTIDGVSIDADGCLWIKEYKTAKLAEQNHYQTDPQVTTYVWAASHIYNRPVIGVEYWQFVKKAPEPPRVLSSGKISTASNLVSSYPLYYQALEDMYGDPNRAPKENKEKLAQIGAAETEFKDRFVLMERIRRNEHMSNAEAVKILLECEDMLNPDLPLYPNPTRDCSRMCSFLGACVTMDDGGDWEYELELEFSERDQAPDRLWRERLPPVETLLAMMEAKQTPDLQFLQDSLRTASSSRLAEIEAGAITDIPMLDREPAEFKWED